MDIGTVVLIITTALLLTKAAAFIQSLRLAHRVDGRPGGRIISILSRMLGFIVVGQVFVTVTVYHIDAMPMNEEHLLQLAFLLLSQGIILVGLIWGSNALRHLAHGK